jgi:Zn-dependent protease with chaperone function
MDFFAAQQQALQRSRRLVLGFALCVLGVIAASFVVAVLFKTWLFETGSAGAPDFVSLWWDPQLLGWVAASVGGLITLGSSYKQIRLSGGGSVVARDLGGRPVAPSTTDPDERRLLNVVEEMAIAAGVPVPEVWVLDDEAGINAFAAGTDPANAVIGVTRGCMELLSRDELQGVVAHEFSHIVNGDMRLNQRLIGWGFGLIMVSMAGRLVLESFRHVRIRSSSRDSRDGSGALVIALLAAGLSLWLIGSLGTFFARLLQAAVSRQREFLADAAAVQFTRNPSGIAGALKKIGGHVRQGGLSHAQAGEARHLFFVSSDFIRLALATHPPLTERIRRLDPAWDGRLLTPKRKAPSIPPPPPVMPLMASLGFTERIDPGVGRAVRAKLQAEQKSLTSKNDAQALILGLLLSRDAIASQEAVSRLAEQGEAGLAEQALDWSQRLRGRPALEKLALLDLALPWLRHQGEEGSERFIGLTRSLIAADGRLDLFEFMLQKAMERQLAIAAGLRRPVPVRHPHLRQISAPTATLLQAFASVSGHPESLSAAAEEFQQHTGHPLPPVPETGITLTQVADALTEIEAATPMVKSAVLRLGVCIALHDNHFNDEELELLRAAADAIGASIPPLARVMR